MTDKRINYEGCIRQDADFDQVHRCKEDLKSHEESFKTYSNILSLASNEVRFKIIYLLQKEERLCVCNLSDILGLNMSPVSQHLRKLSDGKILHKEKIGQTIFYFLSPAYKQAFQKLPEMVDNHEMLSSLNTA